MLKDLLAAKVECDAYLDRIIYGEPDQDNEADVIQLLAESVESPLLRDMYLNRGVNAKEEIVWTKVSEHTETPYAAASALCLAAFHSPNVNSKERYVRAALLEDPDHVLAGLMDKALSYGIVDRMNKAIASGAAKAHQNYINACAEGA